jgi:hypothetical protein
MPRVVNITIPDEESVPEIALFSPEENYLMLKIGSSCIIEGRKAIANLTQLELYDKIKEESREEVKKLEIDLMVQKELVNQKGEIVSQMYEGQIEQHKKHIDALREQIRNYELGCAELIEKEIKRERERYDLLLLEKDRQNQLNRDSFDKAIEKTEKLKPNSKTSIEIGDNGENIFESLSETFKDFSGYRIEHKAKQGHKGDFHLFFDEFNVLVDSKNYTGIIQKKERIKIENDLIANNNMNFAWMVSLNTNIGNHSRFPISCEWINTENGSKCILFINNLLEHNPKDRLRQAWLICNEMMRLTKDLKKDDCDLLKHIERELVLKKQIKYLQDGTSELRRNTNASLNVLKNMDIQLIEMLSILTTEIINDTFELTNQINEWWNDTIEYTNDESTVNSTELWLRFKRDNKDFILQKKITIECFKNEITNIVDSSTYSEKTKKGSIEFVGFKIKKEEKKEEKKGDKKEDKKVKTNKQKFIFDEGMENKILEEYEDTNKNIMDISSTNNILPWQVVSLLIENKKIQKRGEARGYEIYIDTEEYKSKLVKK